MFTKTDWEKELDITRDVDGNVVKAVDINTGETWTSEDERLRELMDRPVNYNKK